VWTGFIWLIVRSSDGLVGFGEHGNEPFQGSPCTIEIVPKSLQVNAGIVP
jgi:hypothetical protein